MSNKHLSTESTGAAGNTDDGTPLIRCSQVGVSFEKSGARVRIIDGVDLAIKRGEFVSIIGASGSGKTTLLRVIGGLQAYDRGNVQFRGSEIRGIESGVVTVFQDYSNSLLPWRTVRKNVALGIEANLPAATVRERVDEVLEMVALSDNADAYPWQLSGGMQQRVQIARALATRPSVLLMDEPFGALDALTRSSLQDELLKVQDQTGATVVFVTHDVDEAAYLSNRIVVIGGGPPANIVLELPINIPGPRNQITTKESPEYLRARHDAIVALTGQH